MSLRPDWLKIVSLDSLRADALAGLLGAVLVLPQAIAFATLAGLPRTVRPVFGDRAVHRRRAVRLELACGDAGRRMRTRWRCSRCWRRWRRSAAPAYIELALAVTVLVGLMQFATGVLRLGSIANFISPTALHGFTGGAALLIAIHALKDGLGLRLPTGQHAAQVLLEVLARWHEVDPGALLVAAPRSPPPSRLRRWRPGWPFMLIGLAVGTALAWALAQSGVFAPVRVVGPLAVAVAALQVPDVPWQRLPELLGVASALAVVALAQSISIAEPWPTALASASTATANSSARAWRTSRAASSLVTSPAAR